MLKLAHSTRSALERAQVLRVSCTAQCPLYRRAIRYATTNRSKPRSAISARHGPKHGKKEWMATAWRKPACLRPSPNWSAPMARTPWPNSWKAFPAAFAMASFRRRWPSSSRRKSPLQRFQNPHRFAGRGRDDLALPHHPPAAHKGADRPAGDAHAVIGRPARARGHPFVGDGLAALEIDHGKVRVIARRDPALAGDIEQPRRACAGQIDKPCQRQS